MTRNRITRAAIFSAVVALGGASALAQDATNANADATKQQEEKTKLQDKAAATLEQVISEAQALKLPENRIRVQVIAGDLLWDRSAARARTLLNDAGAMLAQMMTEADATDRDDMQTLTRLRQDLVLTAARHDAELAYSLLRQTQPPANSANLGNRRRGGFPQQDNLEQVVLGVIASTDPKVAYQKASESLDKGEYPTSLARVLAQLQAKDDEAYKKLTDKTLSRLTSDNLLASGQADNLALALLRPGPRPATTQTISTASPANGATSNSQVLTDSAYHSLLEQTITAALTATPNTNNGGGGGGNQQRRGQRREALIISDNGPLSATLESPNQPAQTDPAQTQQNNARMLLRGLQGMLPQIDQYLPERGQTVRQKLTEVGMNGALGNFGNQLRNLMQQNDSESLANAAAVAPAQLQPRLYEEAARKALDEGNIDRAQQIASDHLDESSRNSIVQAIDLKKATINVTEEKLGEIRQKLAALPSDSDRIKFLSDLVTGAQKDNPKLALKFAEDARALVAKRATNYDDMSNQLKVAEIFASIDPKRSFEVLEPGIAQLNELLAAAQVLNGFEVEVYREGELPLQGNSELGQMISRYGQELASLAKLDFERAQMTAEKFQFAEPRLMAKLAIAQGAFGVKPMTPQNDGRFNFRFFTR